MPDLVAAVTSQGLGGWGAGGLGGWGAGGCRGHGARYQTQTGECGSGRGLTPPPAPHKFAQCNNST